MSFDSTINRAAVADSHGAQSLSEWHGNRRSRPLPIMLVVRTAPPAAATSSVADRDAVISRLKGISDNQNGKKRLVSLLLREPSPHCAACRVPVKTPGIRPKPLRDGKTPVLVCRGCFDKWKAPRLAEVERRHQQLQDMVTESPNCSTCGRGMKLVRQGGNRLSKRDQRLRPCLVPRDGQSVLVCGSCARGGAR